MKISSKWNEILKPFEEYEEELFISLEKFMDEDFYFKYDFGINELVYEPGDSIFELFKSDILKIYLNYKFFHHTENM